MCRCVCMHVHIFICMYAFTCICVYAWMYICVYVYVHVHVYIYICICVCKYIHYLYITCMCSLFHLALGNEDGGVQLVYESACCLAWGAILDTGKDSAVVCVFSIFNAGKSVCVCEWYTHTHTYTAQVLGCEPRSRDETPGEPEESKWTKSCHTYIRICVQSTHVYIYVKRRDKILD